MSELIPRLIEAIQMGVQDNPKVLGGWLVKGLGGIVNLIERLAAEGYLFEDDHRAEILAVSGRLRDVFVTTGVDAAQAERAAGGD